MLSRAAFSRVQMKHSGAAYKQKTHIMNVQQDVFLPFITVPVTPYGNVFIFFQPKYIVNKYSTYVVNIEGK